MEKNSLNTLEKRHGICLKETITILILLLAGICPFFLMPLSVTDFLNFQTINKFAVYLILPVPFAYAAFLSFRRFRMESTIAFIFLPFTLVFPEHQFLFIFFGIAPVLASWQARNTFNGRNYFWSIYHSLSLVFAFYSIIFAFGLANLYGYDNTFQSEIQGVISGQTNELFSKLDLFSFPKEIEDNGSGFNSSQVFSGLFT